MVSVHSVSAVGLIHQFHIEFTTMQFGKRDMPNALCHKKLSILFILGSLLKGGSKRATSFGGLVRAPSAPFISGSFFVVAQCIVK